MARPAPAAATAAGRAATASASAFGGQDRDELAVAREVLDREHGRVAGDHLRFAAPVPRSPSPERTTLTLITGCEPERRVLARIESEPDDAVARLRARPRQRRPRGEQRARREVDQSDPAHHLAHLALVEASERVVARDVDDPEIVGA